MDFHSTSRIDLVIAAGRAAHPAVAPSAAIRSLVEPCAEVALAAGDPRAADLYLAMACAAGDPVAIAALDAMLPPMIRPVLARMGAAGSDDDEIIQRVRVSLFTPTGERGPGIAGYSARGDLRGYVRAIAARLALKRLEREELASPDDDTEVLALLPADGDTPELRVLKARYRDDVRRAFAAAIAACSPRDRTLLRQHYVDAVSLEALAALHGVHRATCARWLASAREEIVASLRAQLHAAHGDEQRDLESAIELVRSQLDLSLSRHLR